MGIKVCLPYAQISKLSLNKLLILFYYTTTTRSSCSTFAHFDSESECDVKVTYKKHTNV